MTPQLIVMLVLGFLAIPWLEVRSIRKHYRVKTGLRVFVKLLPVRSLVLKIAYKSEKDKSWRARKLTIASVGSSRDVGLDIIKNTLLEGVYKEDITVFNMGYRSKKQKLVDYIRGLEYPVVTETTLELLDSLETGSMPDRLEDADEEKLKKTLNQLKGRVGV